MKALVCTSVNGLIPGGKGVMTVPADCIVNDNHDYLLEFLEGLAVPEHSATIQDWDTSGRVYLDYIRVIKTLQDIQQVGGLLSGGVRPGGGRSQVWGEDRGLVVGGVRSGEESVLTYSLVSGGECRLPAGASLWRRDVPVQQN